MTPPHLLLMAMDLIAAGELAAAERLMSEGQELHPNDFWLSHEGRFFQAR